MTPEGKVKARVKALLTEHGAYYHMPVQAGYGAPALDFWVCHNGRFAGIETKAPGKKPTPRQKLTIEQVVEAGGVAMVIDGTDYEELEEWLKS